MEAELRVRLHSSALAGMRESRPKNLLETLKFFAEDAETVADLELDDFHGALRTAKPGDPLLELWRKQLAGWDIVIGPKWSEAPAKSEERRAAVYALLALSSETQDLLNELLPITREASPTVIGEAHRPWYSDDKTAARAWYWPRYERLLLASHQWPIESVAGLDEATTRIVERLADPTGPAYQSKGLVVGYVQSGKTANFTGVIAKAMDAGYRLIIVLAGTLNILRAQTQRRLDMDLIGRENVLRGRADSESEYAADPAWIRGDFISFGGMPSELGGFDIHRMTTHESDYESLLQGIIALEADRPNKSVPLNDPQNLFRSAARIMVVKKNKLILGKLVSDLRQLKTPLADIPTIIIDDESDEASVNTRKQSHPADTPADRTAINEKISELLTLLKRAQYIGYTATPYANVFIDPSDVADIFPKDFIISLPRPMGYMGAEDFHDLDSDVPETERDVANSNEKAFVRPIGGIEGEDEQPLREAIDMFVLTAAVKLYRQDAGRHNSDRYDFRHHTMLIHESSRRADHRQLEQLVTRLWFESGYSGKSGWDRLRKLFEKDVLPVSSARASNEPLPVRYEDLMPYVSQAISRIGGDDQPVIVVNSDSDIEKGVADFDKRAIWKILIGGQKLSRGFTVEGLTISYYRRRTNNASSLMQMGRWFGFRTGYRDLVRLYIGRAEGGPRRELDLYEAFEAICLDENLFREQLAQYAQPVDGQPQITPLQVQPLVAQRHPRLKPTARNKMYNAQLVEVRTPGRWEEPSAYPSKAEGIVKNFELWSPVVRQLSMVTETFPGFTVRRDGTTVSRPYDAHTALVTHPELLAILRNLVWNGSQFDPHLEYLEEIGRGSAQVDDWLVIAPQNSVSTQRFTFETRSLSWFGRSRRRDPLFGAISEPRHRYAAIQIARAEVSTGDSTLDRYASARRGVVVLYPIVEPSSRAVAELSSVISPKHVVMGFAFVAPAEAYGDDRRLLRFRAVDNSRAGAAIVSSLV